MMLPPSRILPLSLLALILACKKAEPPPKEPAVPVEGESAVTRDIPLLRKSVGTVMTVRQVEVQSLVDGTIQRVHFEPGEEVIKDALLFTLDPRPFIAALREAQAKLKHGQILAARAKKDLARSSELLAKDYVTEKAHDEAVATYESLRATVAMDRAAVEQAQIELSYTRIKAPLNGRTGEIIENEGNLVQKNTDTLAVINQIRPIYVSFTIPEQLLAEIKASMARGKLLVQAFIPESQGPPQEGYLTFMDNRVNLETGTIELRATFANAGGELWPGQFVNVVLTLALLPQALVVPSRAIDRGQEGQYVFVIKDDLTVELRQVVTGPTHEGWTVIESGLKAGEAVVTDGQMRLRPGTRVRLKGSVRVSEGPL